MNPAVSAMKARAAEPPRVFTPDLLTRLSVANELIRGLRDGQVKVNHIDMTHGIRPVLEVSPIAASSLSKLAHGINFRRESTGRRIGYVIVGGCYVVWPTNP